MKLISLDPVTYFEDTFILDSQNTSLNSAQDCILYTRRPR